MPLISGIAALVGAGTAAWKHIQDDKASRYPPEYLMYKDMMKMAKKGYPVGMMNQMMNLNMMNQMNQMMMNPMLMNQMGQLMYQQPNPLMCQPLQQQPQQSQMNNQLVLLVQQILQQCQLQQQQTTNQIAQILQQVQLQQPKVVYTSSPVSVPSVPVTPMMNPPVVNPLINFQFQMPDCSTLPTKPMWDSPADGSNTYQPSQYPLAVVKPPVVQLPPPPPVQQPQFCMPPVVQQPVPQQKYDINWCNTQEALNRPVEAVICPPNQPSLSWGNPNAFSVDNTGLQSFIDYCERQNRNQHPTPPSSTYFGNGW